MRRFERDQAGVTRSSYHVALASGFGAQAVVRWVGLPLFESVRGRVASSSGN